MDAGPFEARRVEDGHESFVILTTQSPVLLNFMRPEEVRIVRRNAEGATEVAVSMRKRV